MRHRALEATGARLRPVLGRSKGTRRRRREERWSAPMRRTDSSYRPLRPPELMVEMQQTCFMTEVHWRSPCRMPIWGVAPTRLPPSDWLIAPSKRRTFWPQGRSLVTLKDNGVARLQEGLGLSWTIMDNLVPKKCRVPPSSTLGPNLWRRNWFGPQGRVVRDSPLRRLS